MSNKPEPVVNQWEPIRNPSGVYYSVQRLVGDGMEALRDFFPDAKADKITNITIPKNGMGWDFNGNLIVDKPRTFVRYTHDQ